MKRQNEQVHTTLTQQVRTPLNALLSCCTLLTDTQLTAEQKEYINLMIACGSQITNNVDYVLVLFSIISRNTSAFLI